MTTPAPIPYVPQPIHSAAELSALLSSPLSELRRTAAIKPYLDLLNEIAFHQQRWAADVVRLTLEAIEQERVADRRLALFYLFDTFCKNRRLSSLYRRLLAPLIQPPFVSTYKHATDATKRQMDKLLTAWRSNAIFDSSVLEGIEARLKEADSATSGGKRPADVLGDSDVLHKVSNSAATSTSGRERERPISIKCELCCGQQRAAAAAGCLRMWAVFDWPQHSSLAAHSEQWIAPAALSVFRVAKKGSYIRFIHPRLLSCGLACSLLSSQRARTDQPPPLLPQPTPLTPQVQETLRMLEVSLAQHPHLLPLLYDIKAMLNMPGVDLAQVAPKIAALTSSLQAAMQQPQQPQRQTPSPQPIPPQPTLQQAPPVGSVNRTSHAQLPTTNSHFFENMFTFYPFACPSAVTSYPPYGSGYNAPYQPQYAHQPQPQAHYPQHAAAPSYPYHQQHQQPSAAPYAPYPPANTPYLQLQAHSYSRTSPERELKPHFHKPKTFETEDLKTSVVQHNHHLTRSVMLVCRREADLFFSSLITVFRWHLFFPYVCVLLLDATST